MRKSLFTTTIVLFFILQNLNAQQWSPITNNNVWNLNSGNLGVGTTNPLFKLDVNGEIKSTLTGASNLRMVGGGYAAMLRNDGLNTYLLYTNVNDINGGWNNLRPIRVSNSNGDVYLAGENVIMQHNTGNVGIGVFPEYKLDVNGRLFLRTVETVSGWSRSYLNWAAHSLVMGSSAGTYAYNSVDFEPGGCSQAPLYSQLRMYTAQNTTQKDLKIQFNTMSTSFINNDGYLGIGTTSPRVKLDVNGTISAKEARIEGSVIATKLMARSNVWADYVFDENYKLKSLNELDTYIKENKHLPEVPSTNEVIENGIDIAQMNVILLKKVEELTLHLIEQNKKINSLESKINELQK